jgi:hypothetical protein
MRTRIGLGAALAAVMMVGGAMAQTPQPAKQQECAQTESQPKPATPPEQGPKSGPNNMGSTGWTGGMPDAGSGKPGSSSAQNPEQPATAKGLDPTEPNASQPTKC